MKRIVSLFFLLIHALSAEIYEIAHFEEILPHIDCHTLVLLDIDNTLIEPVQQLGNDAWFSYRRKWHYQRGIGKKEALEQALREWRAVQNLTKVRAVEETTARIVKEIQEKYRVVGISTRGLGMATLTTQQLSCVGIDLQSKAPCKQDLFFLTTRGVLYHSGILFIPKRIQKLEI